MGAPAASFVPDGFVVPNELLDGGFRLVPLTPAVNEADYEAWTSSIDHIRATPGFAGRRWPDPALTLDDNRRDLEGHARHFTERVGFTYSVLEAASGAVIGCVYIYPGDAPGAAVVRSWVRASHRHLDADLSDVVTRWLAATWPFTAVEYSDRRPVAEG